MEVKLSLADIFSLATYDKGEVCRVEGCTRPRKKERNSIALGRRLRSREVCAAHYSQFLRARNPVLYAYHACKGKAKRRGIPFLLTIEEFREFSARTGYVGERGRDGECLQLDRIDSRKGYTADNIQAVRASDHGRKSLRERNERRGYRQCREHDYGEPQGFTCDVADFLADDCEEGGEPF